MLKSIEMWDFESHAHTLVDGLSDGLNLICGESNAGKTSIVRALRLVAYNEFDPDSLRVGAKRCKVRVTSDKGVVQVTRGPKDNLWEVTENGKPTKALDKVGVQVVPEACKILGLGIVRLGDMDVPVNIMEQLESHFMLSGIGDEKSSGSIRAQIIDEISGLSGIEGVIKSVSLDNTRFGREVKSLEKDICKTQSQLHDQSVLDKEGLVLGEAEKHLKEHDDYLVAHASATAVTQEVEAVDEKSGELDTQLLALPDVDKATEFLEAAKDGTEVVSDGKHLISDSESVKGAIRSLNTELGRIGDVESAGSCIVMSDKSISKAQGMRRLLKEKKDTSERSDALGVRLDSLPDESSAQTAIEKCIQLITRAKSCVSFARECDAVSVDFGELEAEMKENNGKLAQAFKEQDRILKSITICPINLGPVSPDCLKGVGTPVTEGVG